MCGFEDENGKVLEVGDEIEYWSPSYKDWFKARVEEINSKRQMLRVEDGLGGYKSEPGTVTKIKVSRWNADHNRYMHYGYQVLTAKSTTRKI